MEGNGTVIHLHGLDDGAGLVALFDRLERHTAYQRFFSVLNWLPPANSSPNVEDVGSVSPSWQ